MADQSIRVGPKKRHLALPDGAAIVTGPMQEGDLVANIYKACWESIDPEDVGLDASMYDHVCRPPKKETT